MEMSSIFEGVLDASMDFNQSLNIPQSGHVETNQKVIKNTSRSQEHQNHHQLQQELQKYHQSLMEFLMPSNSSDFNQILNIPPSGHVKTIQNVSKDTSTSQEHQNQLQPKIYKCHQSLKGFLMPSNSSDFNQILNIAPSRTPQSSSNQTSTEPFGWSIAELSLFYYCS